jgi:hypothetical protein
VVEFGMLALMFTLLMFGVVDLGLLLNSWVRLSAATREVARAASVGYVGSALSTMASDLVLPGVNRAAQPPFVGYCCGAGGANDELVLDVQYYNGDPTLLPTPCVPGAAGCAPVDRATQVDSRYWGGGVICPTPPCAGLHPLRGDIIVVSLAAPGMQVITPLVRPFFGCASSAAQCYVRLGSTAVMRYEGQ